MNFYFLQTKFDEASKKWVISSQAKLNPGFEFIILCDTQLSAMETVSKINSQKLKIPTVDKTGFATMDGFEHLVPTKVFRPA